MKFKLIAAALCAAGIALPAFAGDADDVKAVVAKAAKAFNSCDVAAMKGITSKDSFEFNNDGTLTTGNDMAGMKAACDAGVKSDYKVTVLKVDVRGDMAVVAGTGKGTVTPKEGEAQNREAKFTLVMIKDGGAWKSLHVHASPIVKEGGSE